MHKAIEWFKKHPLALVLVGGVVILFYVLFSGSGSSSAAASGGDPNAPAEIAANAQITQAQIGASASEFTTASQADVQNNQTAAQLAATQIGANVALAQNHTAEDINLAGIASQVQLADIAAQTNQAQIAATTNQAALQAQTYEYLAMEQAATTQKSFQTEADIAATNANANVQAAQYQFLTNAVNAANTSKKSTLSLTTPNGVSVNYVNSKGPATQQSSGSAIGGILGGVLGAVGAFF